MYHQRQKTENHIHMHCQKGTDQRNKKMAEQNRNYGQIKEITMHFGKGTVCIRRNQVAAFAAMSGHGAERVAGLK